MNGNLPLIHAIHAMKRLAVSVTFILLICSCTYQDRSVSLKSLPTENVSIEWDRQTKVLDTTEYTISKVVPLKKDSMMFIGQVDRMEFHNGHVFVLDREYAKRVFVFDSLGNMSACIGRLGRADNEYLRGPSDFSIDRKKDELCVMEAESNKIIRYSYDGKVKQICRIKEFWPYSFSCLSDGNLAFSFRMMDNNSNTDNCELVASDTSFNVQRRWRPLAHHQIFTKDFPFWNIDGGVYFIPNLSDTVLCFSGDTIGRKIHIDFQGQFLSPKDAGKVMKEGDYSILCNKEGVVNSICKYEENEDWINIEYSTGIMFHYLQNRTTGAEYQGISLFDGIFPLRGLFINGKHLTCVILEDDIATYRRLLSDNNLEINAQYAKSNSVIKNLIEGKIPLPALLYIDIKE